MTTSDEPEHNRPDTSDVGARFDDPPAGMSLDAGADHFDGVDPDGTDAPIALGGDTNAVTALDEAIEAAEADAAEADIGIALPAPDATPIALGGIDDDTDDDTDDDADDASPIETMAASDPAGLPASLPDGAVIDPVEPDSLDDADGASADDDLAADELAADDLADSAPAPRAAVPASPAEPQADQEDLVDDLVGDLFRDVDSRFNRLEQQYLEARKDFSPDTYDQTVAQGDPVAASAARFELVEEIATLRADVERQAAELDERDRMLGELSERLLDFETRHRAAGAAAGEAEALRQQLHDDRRELTRVQALLDASVVEREELSGVAQRLQQDNDELEQRLVRALERFDEVERSRSSLADGVAQLEAARDAESAEHANRHEELQSARSEVRRLTEIVDELTTGREEAVRRADRVEHDVERRANEIGYLNRRIEALTERANESDTLDANVRELTEEQARLNRRIGDLERELDAKTAEAAASARAVEALADRSSQNDALLLRVRELEAAASAPPPTAAPTPAPTPPNELHELAERARALGEQRSSSGYEPLGVESLAPRADSDAGAAADLSHLPPPPPPPDDDIAVPQIEVPGSASAWAADATSATAVAPSGTAPYDPGLPPPPPVGETPIEPPAIGLPEPAAVSLGAASPEPSGRRRVVLPAEMHPDTPEAVEYLLGQPRLTAIVDARSVCATVGMRPSELFTQLEQLRDRFDLPIEVVVTPVSTPVGGAPELPAIGVHPVTGADTVSDRVRALCIGFPDDEQLVVIAGDDHVRRAAIGKEANVVDPAVALGLV